MTAPLQLPTLSDLTEKQWASQVANLAKALGWHRYHTHRSTRSEPGWPDEALVRERLVLLELKTETGRLSGPQKSWLAALRMAGVEVYVARPRHLSALSRILSVRARNGDFPPGERGEQARIARSELVQHFREEVGV